jgi:hypothetical protein
MGEGRVSLTPYTDFYRPVEELEYTDLLRAPSPSPVTKGASKLGGHRQLTLSVSFVEKSIVTYRWGKGEVECHMDPTITKASTDNERLVTVCAESQSTSRGPNRTRFLTVQVVIRAKMQCDKKTFLVDADASKKRNLLLVGGHVDNPVEVCGEDNADVKRPCLEGGIGSIRR